jgi:hypothetical protein
LPELTIRVVVGTKIYHGDTEGTEFHGEKEKKEVLSRLLPILSVFLRVSVVTLFSTVTFFFSTVTHYKRSAPGRAFFFSKTGKPGPGRGYVSPAGFY